MTNPSNEPVPDGEQLESDPELPLSATNQEHIHERLERLEAAEARRRVAVQPETTATPTAAPAAPEPRSALDELDDDVASELG